MSEVIPHPQRSVFDEELRTTRSAVTEMGELVDRAISGAMVGLMEREVDACAVVIAEDARTNELQREVREQSFTMILTQAPVARDLREIMGLLHMSAELERMGDHCVSIAKIARSLADFPQLATHVDLPKMAQFCREQVATSSPRWSPATSPGPGWWRRATTGSTGSTTASSTSSSS